MIHDINLAVSVKGQSEFIKRKGKNFVRSTPNVYIDDCSNDEQPVSILTHPFSICARPLISLQVCSPSLHIHSISINLHTVFLQTQTLIVHVCSIHFFNSTRDISKT